jgi:hypothetical protein
MNHFSTDIEKVVRDVESKMERYAYNLQKGEKKLNKMIKDGLVDTESRKDAIINIALGGEKKLTATIANNKINKETVL